MREPLWLTRFDVDVMHEALLSRLGGSQGVRDGGLIDSALERPRNRFAYAESIDIYDLAAAYLFGLVKNHGYVDGNKRVGFSAAGVFLLVNGWRVIATEESAYDLVDGVAAGRYSEQDAATWLRTNSARREIGSSKP